MKICTRHHFKPFDRCCGLHLTLTGKGGSFLYSLIQNVFEPLDSDPDRKTSWNIHFAPPVSNLSSGVPADLCPQREDRRWLFSTRSLCLSFCLTEFPSPGSILSSLGAQVFSLFSSPTTFQDTTHGLSRPELSHRVFLKSIHLLPSIPF